MTSALAARPLPTFRRCSRPLRAGPDQPCRPPLRRIRPRMPYAAPPNPVCPRKVDTLPCKSRTYTLSLSGRRKIQCQGSKRSRSPPSAVKLQRSTRYENRSPASGLSGAATPRPAPTPTPARGLTPAAISLCRRICGFPSVSNGPGILCRLLIPPETKRCQPGLRMLY